MRDMGYATELDFSKMCEFVLESAGSALQDQARRFLAAAQSNESLSVGQYAAWREETHYTHATGTMAVAYAPAKGDAPFPYVMDPDLTSHVYALLLVMTLTFHLLVEECVRRESTMIVVDSFLGTQ